MKSREYVENVKFVYSVTYLLVYEVTMSKVWFRPFKKIFFQWIIGIFNTLKSNLGDNIVSEVLFLAPKG